MVKNGYYGNEGFGLLWDRIRAAPWKNGKKWKEYKNWVKILSDSCKRAFLVRKNCEKWGNIEMKIGSSFEPRLNCSRALHVILLYRAGTISHLNPKIWNVLLEEYREFDSLSIFK